MTVDKSITSHLTPPPVTGLAGRVVASAVISSFLFGYSICVLNSCGELIAVTLDWCDSDWDASCGASQWKQGLVNASLYLGATLGALLIGRPSIFTLGSRSQLVLADVFWLVGAACALLAPGFELLTLGRFFSGVGLGLSAIAGPVYIAEISPRENRGLNSAIHGVFITIGILASIAFGIPQDPPPSGPELPLEGLNVWYWRCLLGFPLLPAVLQASLLYLALPIDPPSFLVQRGQFDQARDMLYRIYDVTPMTTLDLANKAQAELELQLKDLKEACDMARSIPPVKVIAAVGDPFLRVAVFLGAGLAAFQQLCGINGLMSYSNSLFAQAGIEPAHLTMASTAMATANVCASLMSSRVVDKWGRRTLLMSGSFVQTCAMACLILCTDERLNRWLPPSAVGPAAVIFFTIFVMSFSFGLGALTWLYLSEIYPMEIRGPSLSMCGVINWLSSFAVVFGTRFLSLTSACYVYGTVCLIGFICTAIWVVETKGCDMEDSPLTPRSGREGSTILSNAGSDAPYTKMEEDEGDVSDDGKSTAATVSVA